jgi:FtsP/CotA-like multicopper oxidase with cupredoxin domain
MYAPMIIDPIEPEPFRYTRDYVVMLSDWSFESPETLLSNLKKQGSYYNFQKRTASDFFADVGRMGFWPALQNYLMWDQMRMDPTDFADVTGYTFTYLMNGLSPAGNWTGLFRSRRAGAPALHQRGQYDLLRRAHPRSQDDGGAGRRAERPARRGG